VANGPNIFKMLLVYIFTYQRVVACVSRSGRPAGWQGYRPTVFNPKPSTKHAVYATLATQCEKADIPSLMYLPSDAQLVADSYCLVVDAIFGVGFAPPMSSDFAAIVQTITRSKVPVVSIDVPSGRPPPFMLADRGVRLSNPDSYQKRAWFASRDPFLRAQLWTRKNFATHAVN